MSVPELRRGWHDPEERIRLFMLTNERADGTEYGFRAEFERLQREGVISQYRAMAPLAALAAGRDWLADALQTMHEIRPNVLLVLSPSKLQVTSDMLAQLLSVCSPTVLYWEGDAWGRGKPVTRAMKRWAAIADTLFTVSGGLDRDSFGRQGPRAVRQVLNTYCHVQFAEAEAAPPGRHPPPDDVSMIGSSVLRLGLVSTIPGGATRARLVRRLQRLDLEVAIYGNGWRGKTRGPVPYGGQIDRLRESRISVNWDHYPEHPNYASDRLPISLLAGRVHISTRHPGLSLYRNEGLVEVADMVEALDTLRELLDRPWEELRELGESGWQYARFRLSDREAARFMLRAVDHRVPAPPTHPWEQVELLATTTEYITLRS